MDYKNLSLIELSELIQDKKATSAEIYEYFLDRALKYNDELNAFNTLPSEFSLTHHSEGRRIHDRESLDPSQTQDDRNKLPIAVKDLFCEK